MFNDFQRLLNKRMENKEIKKNLTLYWTLGLNI